MGVKDGGGGRVGDKYVDDHDDPKRRKKLKRKTIWKNPGGNHHSLFTTQTLLGIFVFHFFSFILPFTSFLKAGAHKRERATSMRSCHGVFTDQFILRTVLARVLNIF